jgi:hypothetical protein
MSNGRKLLLAVFALLGGATLNGCLSWGGFTEGLFAKGFTDNWYLDVLTDWLNEDLFS